MGRAERGRLSSTIVLTLASAVFAGAAAAYVLYAAHSPHQPDPSLSADGAISGDNMSVEERRELTRQMLKARRENPEVPEEVRPTPSTRTATTGTGDSGATVENVKPRAANVTTSTPASRTSPPRRADASPTATLNPAQAASTNNSVAVTAPGQAGVPTPLGEVAIVAPPIVAPTTGVTPPPGLVARGPGSVAPGVADGGLSTGPEQRGLAANVLSSISGIVGTAANVTGNTVNWVIDLPGRAISAGGRLLGGGAPSANAPLAQQPAQSVQPVPPGDQPGQSVPSGQPGQQGQPAPKRNYL
jgi:hypothetical protein